MLGRREIFLSSRFWTPKIATEHTFYYQTGQTKEGWGFALVRKWKRVAKKCIIWISDEGLKFYYYY